MAESDPPEEVMHRTVYLYENGYGKYDFMNDNCEDFALYCKTDLWSTDKRTRKSRDPSLRKETIYIVGGIKHIFTTVRAEGVITLVAALILGVKKATCVIVLQPFPRVQRWPNVVDVYVAKQKNNAEQSTPPTPQTQSSQAASVEVEPETTSPRNTKRGGKRAAKKGRRQLLDEMVDFEKNPDVSETTLRWTPEEEVLLAVCWVAVSEDSNVGVSQKGITFWYKVMHEFNKQNFQVRNKDMLSSKWHTLNANCQKFLACYKRAVRTRKSGENEVDDMRNARQMYRDEHKGVAFSQEDAWYILKKCLKWDAPTPIDLTGDVPGQTNQELFGDDARPRPPGKQRSSKKQKSDTSTSTGGSASSNLESMTTELRLRREAAQMPYEAARMKDEMTTRMKEFKFLGMKMSEVDPDEAYFIKMEKQRIKEKYKLQLPPTNPNDSD
ncbi:endopeptidase, NLPC/P60 domain, LRAT-like domain protein [Artemisia annua]|uniref:Endopeptidase, NLPC/P60 domain, LRAT-like domain protein n=1 Tax=Artemisia annua TaxID=35608 RepID=A0A2U1N540_ARTAN|nr:endopeptidase, NLPC/P60 domain, LRAT-like domain protein [Artemisia annua]